jgi:hypothetical protein
MKTAKFILSPAILILFSIFVSHGQIKLIKIGSDEQIFETSTNNGYISIRTFGRASSTRCGAYLLDRNGTLLLQKHFEEGRFIMLAEASTALDYFVVVEQGYEGAGGLPGKDNIVHAYDIKTGNEIWRAENNAGRYSISPDGIMIMTQIRPTEHGPSGSKYLILNLADGSVQYRLPDLNDAYAEWLDDDRIIIAERQYRRITEDEDNGFSAARMRDVFLDSLISINLRLAVDYGVGKLERQEFNHRSAEITKRIDSLQSEKYNDARQRIARPRKNMRVLAASVLRIVNIRTSRVEIEKEVYASDGQPVLLPLLDYNIGIINIDQSLHDIYLYGFKGDTELASRCLVRLDVQLRVQMTAIPGVARLAKLKIEDELQFVAAVEGNTFVIERSSGRLNEAKMLSTKVGEIALSDELWSTTNPTKTYLQGMVVRQTNGAIELNIRKGIE